MSNLESHNLNTLLETLKKQDWWLIECHLQYAESLKNLGYVFLSRDIMGQTWYFAVHCNYETDFRQGSYDLIPDWAIRSVPYEVYTKYK
jgi:hypothetical protein